MPPRKHTSKDRSTVMVRIPRELYEQLDETIAQQFDEQTMLLRPAGKLSKAMLVRLVLMRGLEAMRAGRGASKRKK